MTDKPIDLSQYKITDEETQTPHYESVLSLEHGEAAGLAKVGVILDEGQRSGTYLMRDFHSVCSYSNVDGLEILPIAEALRKYDWLEEKYYWQLIHPDEDQITNLVESQEEPQGFFLKVFANHKVEYPYQTALYMASANIAQVIHNIVVVEEGASLELITGCLTHQQVDRGLHFAVTESYVGKNAKLTNTMVHSWGADVTVRPRAATSVDAGGIFNSNYVSMRMCADIVSNPSIYLNGEGASANFMSVILAEKGSHVNTGTTVYLNGPDTSAELKHRGVSTGGQIYQGGLVIGNSSCRAHIDCSGMLIGEDTDGFIQSVPGIRANSNEAQLSHEASIGRIAPEQVEYLMSRGFEEGDAISLIIRGFLDAGITGLGSELDAAIRHIADVAAQGEG